jgi:hypothetical protein
LSDANPTHRQGTECLSFLNHPAPDTELDELRLDTTLGPLDVLTTIQGVGDYARVHDASIEIRLFERLGFASLLAPSPAGAAHTPQHSAVVH